MTKKKPEKIERVCPLLEVVGDNTICEYCPTEKGCVDDFWDRGQPVDRDDWDRLLEMAENIVYVRKKGV